MGLWNNLLVAMGTRRTDRIDSTEADQLLAGRSTGATRDGLAALLSEASGPPRPGELADERGAVDGFRQIRDATPAAALSTVDSTGHRRWYGPSPARTALLRLAAVALLLTAIGTATVNLGYRPARMQPTPGQGSSSSAPSPSPSSPQAGRLSSSHPPKAGAQGEPPPSGAPPAATLYQAVQLCQVWTAAAKDDPIRDQEGEHEGGRHHHAHYHAGPHEVQEGKERRLKFTARIVDVTR
jgi:hypothetical protein